MTPVDRVGDRAAFRPGGHGLLWVVARREMAVKLRDRAFIVSGVVMLVLIAAALVVPALLAGGPDRVAVLDAPTAAVVEATGADAVSTPSEADATEAVRSGDVDAAVLPDSSSPTGLRVVALESVSSVLVLGVSEASPVELLAPADADPLVSVFAPLAFGILFMTTSLLFGLSIAQSVVEEKQTRVVEILVAAVPVRTLLAGKVLGAAILAIAQTAVLAAAALGGLSLTGRADALPAELLPSLAAAVGWYVPFFVAGFLLLAGLWAVAGALVSRIEDLGSTTTPVQLLVMLPFFATVFVNTPGPALTTLSFVPFSAPVAMPVRMVLEGGVPVWQPVVALALLVGCAAAVVLVAARLYEGSLLRTGGTTSVGQAWRRR
ncbi:ABC transporter permease [Frigoribacterium sp. ACAM 257]|uniref:ABC transporter permease n=1 Tax=Frigoribacterium sp. ACAM 257 TaxID=2508998 RepID=UPI0011BA0436|nr:ABC transporter permease [Frigoribacterium sp. ACAM 257]TWX40819.1 ABC transporter permease [Frigoribacterium sp. ACAM 257]